MNLKIGNIITTPQDRDAIHMAVAPMTTKVSLRPGTHVGVIDDGTASSSTNQTIGIVDPFLTTNVLPGETFWLFLYPETVTSLRHQWNHPAFPQQAGNSSAEAELRVICRQYGINYADLIEDGHDEVCAGTSSDVPDEFWDLYESVTGRRVKAGDRYIRCAC